MTAGSAVGWDVARDNNSAPSSDRSARSPSRPREDPVALNGQLDLAGPEQNRNQDARVRVNNRWLVDSAATLHGHRAADAGGELRLRPARTNEPVAGRARRTQGPRTAALGQAYAGYVGVGLDRRRCAPRSGAQEVLSRDAAWAREPAGRSGRGATWSRCAEVTATVAVQDLAGAWWGASSTGTTRRAGRRSARGMTGRRRHTRLDTLTFASADSFFDEPRLRGLSLVGGLGVSTRPPARTRCRHGGERRRLLANLPGPLGPVRSGARVAHAARRLPRRNTP